MRKRKKQQGPVKTCLRGHALTEENLTQSGKCLTCRRDREGFKGNVANRDKTHCPKGHPYSGDNVARYNTGKRTLRVCKRCRAMKARKYYRDKLRSVLHPRKAGRPRIYLE